MDFETELARARESDDEDDLARFRRSFMGPADTIYMEGNSLGLCSTEAEQAVQRALDDWRTFAIGGWLSASPPWFSLADETAGLMAPLVGAQPHEIGIGDSTTINLHKFLATFYEPSPSRPKIVADE